MRVEVTKDHIDRGTVGNGYTCPTGLALNEKLRSVRDSVDVFAIVGESRIKIEHYPTRGHKYFPIASADVHTFISDFDGGRPVKPFTVELNVNSGVVKSTTECEAFSKEDLDFFTSLEGNHDLEW